MTRTSAWTTGTVGLCAAIAAASWFLLIQPERAEAAATREQTVAAQQSNAQLEIRIDQLRQEYADLPARQAELAAIRQALPEQPALAGLIREINGAGTDSGVVIDSLTTAAATSVVDPAAATKVVATEGEEVADDAAGGEDAAAADGEITDDTGGAVPTDGAAAAGASVVDGAPAGAVLASVPIIIDTTAAFHESNLFLKALQTDIPRALLIDGLTINVAESQDSEGEEVEPGEVGMTITGRVFAFVDPDSVDAIADLESASTTSD